MFLNLHQYDCNFAVWRQKYQIWRLHFFVLWSSGNKSALVQKPLRTVFALQGSVARLLAAVTGSETGWKQKLSSQTNKLSKRNQFLTSEYEMVKISELEEWRSVFCCLNCFSWTLLVLKNVLHSPRTVLKQTKLQKSSNSTTCQNETKCLITDHYWCRFRNMHS